MKKLSALFVLFAVQTTFISAQNYQPLRSDKHSYFEYDAGFTEKAVRTLLFDSVIYADDSVFYPTPVVYQTGEYCFSPYYSSWIGPKVTVKANGDNLFFNKNNEAILIKTLAEPGEKWIAWGRTDSLYVEAVVSEKAERIFLGLSDSVKTLSFSAYNSTGAEINLKVNGLELEISKSNGLVKALNFYQFPDHDEEYFYENLGEYNLIGMSSPETGFQNFTMLDIFDFQPGDELHVLEYSSNNDFESEDTRSEKKNIYKYLEREDTETSRIYTVEYTYSIEEFENGVEHYSAKVDTVTQEFKSSETFDKQPGIPAISEDELIQYFTFNADSPYKRQGDDWIAFRGDGCWDFVVYDGMCYGGKSYIKGKGGPYYACSSSFSSMAEELRSLQYSKLNGIENGTPFIITEVDTRLASEKFRVYPNPASTQITVTSDIDFSENNSIRIYDVSGKLVLRSSLDSAMQEINITGLEQGLYTLRISSNGENLHSELLVVK